MPSPPSLIWVAEAEGLTGYAALTFDYALWSGERFGHLDCLYVRPEQRGQGTARHLFKAVADATASSGAARLEWQTPFWNANAHQFYTRMGATSVQKHRFHLPLGR
nr:GNAT family N-acetyltransferase [Pseudogemmobacter hezensis]